MIAHEVMAPLMFGGLIVFLLIGYPAAFSLGAVGLFFALIGIELDFFQPTFLAKKLVEKSPAQYLSLIHI